MKNKEKIIQLRRELHKHPEISNKEFETAKRIKAFMSDLSPDEFISLGETSMAFVFKGEEDGETSMFRTELDALPIQENTGLEYASINKNVAHLCGHDGHMSIIAALAQKIAENRPKKGKAVLLFQAAEEVEQGARDIVEHPNFEKIKPDMIFGLHNIPGIKKHSVVMKEGSFAAASRGMTVVLKGKTSHAAEPENGISPTNAIGRIIELVNQIVSDKSSFNDLVLLTIIHIKLGEIAFGTSPGYAELRITLRAYQNEDMNKLIDLLESKIAEITKVESLEYNISYNEVFPATYNHPEAYRLVDRKLKELNAEVIYKDEAFKWSEDFAYYAEKFPACFFGLGAGKDQPQLHNPEYDFPDEIISTAVEIFYALYKQFNL